MTKKKKQNEVDKINQNKFEPYSEDPPRCRETDYSFYIYFFLFLLLVWILILIIII